MSLTVGENSLSLDRATFVAGIIEGYEIGNSKVIINDIYGRVMSIDMSLAFPYLLIKILLDQREHVLLNMDNFVTIYQTTKLGFIRD